MISLGAAAEQAEKGGEGAAAEAAGAEIRHVAVSLFRLINFLHLQQHCNCLLCDA
jgi:hypothetical protein